jgi:hypothetical protein
MSRALVAIVAFALVAATLPAQARETRPASRAESREAGRDELLPITSFADGATTTGWLPLELHRGVYAYVRGRVNGVETDMILDSGASATVLDTAFADILGLEVVGTARARGVGGTRDLRRRGHVRIEIGNMTLRLGQVRDHDFSAMATVRGRSIPMVVGSMLFRELVVDFDFPQSRLALHAPAGFVYAGTGRTIPLFEDEQLLPLVEVKVEGLPPAKFMLDTGSANALEVSPHFWRESSLLDHRRTSPSWGAGIGGRFPVRMATLRSIVVAGHELANVPAGFVEDGEGNVFGTLAKSGLLGMAVLSRFRMILNCPR